MRILRADGFTNHYRCVLHILRPFFRVEKAKPLFLRYDKSLEICTQVLRFVVDAFAIALLLIAYFSLLYIFVFVLQLQYSAAKADFASGKHVLTVVPKSETKVIVAWIITP